MFPTTKIECRKHVELKKVLSGSKILRSVAEFAECHQKWQKSHQAFQMQGPSPAEHKYIREKNNMLQTIILSLYDAQFKSLDKESNHAQFS